MCGTLPSRRGTLTAASQCCCHVWHAPKQERHPHGCFPVLLSCVARSQAGEAPSRLLPSAAVMCGTLPSRRGTLTAASQCCCHELYKQQVYSQDQVYKVTRWETSYVKCTLGLSSNMSLKYNIRSTGLDCIVWCKRNLVKLVALHQIP